MTDPSTLAGELSDEERALLDALWGALEAQDVSFDNGDNTWIDGHFEKGQLAFNMIARLRLAGYTLTKLAESGLVLVPREPTEAMVERVAKIIYESGEYAYGLPDKWEEVIAEPGPSSRYSDAARDARETAHAAIAAMLAATSPPSTTE